MPDVIIKGMEKMPHRCRECFAVQLWDEMDYCQIAERWQPWDAVTRPDWCPLRPAPEWISVEEMRPPSKAPVLLLIKANFLTVQVVARLIENKWLLSWSLEELDLDSDDVLYWMPLPEPPNGGDRDDN